MANATSGAAFLLSSQSGSSFLEAPSCSFPSHFLSGKYLNYNGPFLFIYRLPAAHLIVQLEQLGKLRTYLVSVGPLDTCVISK